MDATIIIAVVPVVLLAAYIIWLVRAKITEGREIDLREPITALVICLVAVLIIGSMTASAVTYTYSEETNTLYINHNIPGNSQPWDSYSDDVRSLVIRDGVTSIGTGAFDSLTGLEYISIPESLESIASSTFGVTLKDYLDQEIPEPEAGEYVGGGDGTLYLCDPSIFTYSANGQSITGLASEASETALVLVLPSERNGTKITSISANAFNTKTQILSAYTLPDSRLATVSGSSFQGCSGLSTLVLPDTVEAIQSYALTGTALEDFEFPSSLKSIGRNAFKGLLLTDLHLPDGLQTIGQQSFRDCTGAESIRFPSSVTAIDALAFSACTGVSSVSFAEGFAATIAADAFASWTFYDTDGTTVLDKTVAANLAGYAFQGTASALVKVAPGQLTLTPDQIQQVHLHDQELQTMLDQPSIDPLPFQPSLQTQEQEPASA